MSIVVCGADFDAVAEAVDEGLGDDVLVLVVIVVFVVVAH